MSKEMSLLVAFAAFAACGVTLIVTGDVVWAAPAVIAFGVLFVIVALGGK